MDLKNIGFEQLLTLVRHLPDEKLATLKAALKAKPSSSRKNKSNTNFRLLLLTGPVMDDKQFETFTENREKFNGWRKN